MAGIRRTEGERGEMSERFTRTRMLFGAEAMEKLSRSRVAVFGVGGVGGYVVEALARSGIGALDLIDNDTVSISNINRQIIALSSTVGRYKVDVAAERVKDINPDCTVRTYKTFYLPQTAGDFDFKDYDYIVDAIDTVTGKLCIVENAVACGTPVISSMGTGNRVDPSMLRIGDISETTYCHLARVMRKELKKRGIYRLDVVWSPEPVMTPEVDEEELAAGGKRSIPGSTAFVPPAAGLLIASHIVRELCKNA